MATRHSRGRNDQINPGITAENNFRTRQFEFFRGGLVITKNEFKIALGDHRSVPYYLKNLLFWNQWILCVNFRPSLYNKPSIDHSGKIIPFCWNPCQASYELVDPLFKILVLLV